MRLHVCVCAQCLAQRGKLALHSCTTMKYIITLPRVGREKCKGQKDCGYSKVCALCHPVQPRTRCNIPVTSLSINQVASCLLSRENLLLCFPSVYSSLGSCHACSCFAVFVLKDVLFHSFVKSFSKAENCTDALIYSSLPFEFLPQVLKLNELYCHLGM